MSCCGPPAPPPVLEPYDFLTSCDRGALGHALSFYSEDAVHRREPGTNCTALHFAAGQGHTHIVAFLLDRGADINAMGRDGRTALAIAAGAGHLSCVALLLRRGADPAVSEGVGCLPVFAAARGDQLAALKMVMDASQPAPTLRDESGHSLLGWAAYRGNLTAVRMLHEMFKVPCDTVDGTGRSPLHWAAREGYTEVAIYLMANGLNPLARDQENVTPLQYAIDRHHPETAAALAARRVTPLETAVGTVKAIAQERWYALYAAANVALFMLGYFSLHFLTPMLCLLPFISAYPMRRLYMHRDRKTGVQGSKPEPTLAEVVDIPNKTADMLHGPAFLRRRDPSHLIMWPLLIAAQLYVAHTLGAPISSGYVSLLLAILMVGGVACKWRALADVVPRGTLQEYPLWAALAEGNYRDAVQLDRVLSSEFLVRVPLRAFRCEQLGALVRRYEGWSHWWDCAVSAANKRWWMLSLLAALFLEVHVLGAGWSLLAAQCPADSPPRSAVLRTFLSLIAQGEPCPAARSVLAGTPVFEHSLVELIAPRNAGGAVLILIPCVLIFCCLHGLGQFLLHAARGISAIEGANATAPATCGGLTSIWRGKGGAQEPVFSEGSATLNLLAMLRGVDGARWATVQALPPAPGSAAEENATAGFATKLALSNQAQAKAAKGGHHGHSH